MNVLRRTQIDTDILMVGDQISVGHYTATCQKVEDDGYIFLLDQYLDEAIPMNKEDTNEGGYEASDLRERLNSAEILDEFSFLELIPFGNGDLLRLPFYGEMFGHDGWYRSGAVEPDDCEQWELMTDRRNRIAERTGESYEYGWFQNKYARFASSFCGVLTDGCAHGWTASKSLGVRPVFFIGKKIERVEE